MVLSGFDALATLRRMIMDPADAFLFIRDVFRTGSRNQLHQRQRGKVPRSHAFCLGLMLTHCLETQD